MNHTDKVISREETSEIVTKYSFDIRYDTKSFCPNCFIFRDEHWINKHFINCSFKLEGIKILKEGPLTVSYFCNDNIFKFFLNKFNKYLNLETNEIKRIPYDSKYHYWILQYMDPNFKCLLIGLAFVRYDSGINRYVLAALIIFPKENCNKRYGTKFIDSINKFYQKYGGIVIESPNNLSEKIAKTLKLDYYFHP